MARLPQPGSDDGQWGDILNEYLSESLTSDGKIKADTVGAAQLKSSSVTNAALVDNTISETKLTPAVQTKLNAVGSSAVTSVAAKTGVVILDKNDVGLNNVNNTSDADKPISTATQTALNTKQAVGSYATTADLTTGLSSKADTSALTSGLAGKLDATSVGTANGIASLDSSSRILENQLPDRLNASAILASATPIRRSTLPPMGIVFMGDSITNFSSNTGQAWHRILGSLSNGRLLWRGMYATSGAKLAAIRDNHLANILSMNPLPGAVAICGGTNDVGDFTLFDETASRSVLLDIITKLEQAGIKPVLWTLPPRDDDTTVNQRVQRWNVWVRYLAGLRALPLIDSHSALVDEATGLYQTALKQDATHPSRYGHFVLGKAVAQDTRFLAQFPTNGTYLSASKGTDPSLISPAARFFDAGLNGNGVPANWAGVALPTNATGSVVTDAAIPGNWFRLTKAAGTSSGQAFIRFEPTAGTSTFQAGDRIAAAVRFKVNCEESTAGAYAQVGFYQRTSSGASVGSALFADVVGNNLDGIMYTEMVIQADVTSIRFEPGIIGAPTVDSWVQYAQPTIINLTKLGIA